MVKRGSGDRAGNRQIALTEEEAATATATSDPHLRTHLLDQLTAALWVPAGTSGEQVVEKAKAALAALTAIAPQNSTESLLAVQMVSTHHAAMECLRRAMLPDQTFEGRDQNLKHATKLLGLYTRQMETLDRHRGKGQQKITVEHVNVHAGGQAIVGNVTKGAGGPAPGSAAEAQAEYLAQNGPAGPEPKALSRQSDIAMPDLDPPKRKTVPAKRRRRNSADE